MQSESDQKEVTKSSEYIENPMFIKRETSEPCL